MKRNNDMFIFHSEHFTSRCENFAPSNVFAHMRDDFYAGYNVFANISFHIYKPVLLDHYYRTFRFDSAHGFRVSTSELSSSASKNVILRYALFRVFLFAKIFTLHPGIRRIHIILNQFEILQTKRNSNHFRLEFGVK